ncbi:TonB-dependent receptor [Coraliomargarita sp. SDUM461004]|uniref:TonB-dependent receptor n=1 Tax=Thalassobacterium sedimentorum TaxID=3041258 RepID=A0ABU1AJX7_9BACT|nr:TonB-dependent receptor [Coraliomargarita sp. SDUM461004]MDQ8195007.1 TonB-dependent receptor [Coraliomargarita sp. SDUM461004]
MEYTLTRKIFLPIAVLSTVSSSLLSPLLIAEELASPEPVDILASTLVSAPRFMDVDTNIASRVQLIDAETIANSGATDLVQLLRHEANIHFRSTSGNSAQSEVSMGGFGENSGQRVLIILDGQRLNTADLAQINWLSIPLGLVESVEVIHGGQSALYGNNAVGGVIKINTRRPTENASGQFQVSGGSFDSYNAQMSYSGRTGGLGYSVHAQHDETDGYRDNSQYEANAGGVKLSWMGSDWLDAYVAVNAVDSEYGLPGPLTRAEFSADPTFSKEYENFGEEQIVYYRAGLDLYLTDTLSFAVDSGYTDREVYAIYYDYSGPTPSFPFELTSEYSIFSISPSLTFSMDSVTAVVGVDYYDDAVDVSTTYGDSEYARETFAGFGSVSYSLTENWMLTASARYEEVATDGVNGGVDLAQVEDDQYAWSLGAIRQYEATGRIYGTVRRFYRYPATDEILVYFPSLSFNPELNAENGYELELGADWSIRDVSVGGRVYQQWMQDEIIYANYTNMNLDETNRLGADLYLNWQINEALSARFDYSWVNAEIGDGVFDGSAIPLVPEHKIRYWLHYQANESIRLSAGATYTHDLYIGGDFANTSGALSDYILVDLSARIRVNEQMELFVTVDNLLDKKYVSTAFDVDVLYPGAGRSAKLGMLWKF